MGLTNDERSSLVELRLEKAKECGIDVCVNTRRKNNNVQYNFHPKVVLLRRRGNCPWIDNCYLHSCHLWIRSNKFADGSFSLHELFSLIDFLGCFFLFVGELF